MQFGEFLDSDNSIMVVFENDELNLGIALMSDLLNAMEKKGGHGVKGMRRWLADVKCKVQNTSQTLQ